MCVTSAGNLIINCPQLHESDPLLSGAEEEQGNKAKDIFDSE